MLAVSVTSMGFCDSKKAGAATSFGASCGVVVWAQSALVAGRAQQRITLVNAFATDASHEREVSVAMGLSRERGRSNIMRADGSRHSFLHFLIGV
jgi:hypothetical protein